MKRFIFSVSVFLFCLSLSGCQNGTVQKSEVTDIATAAPTVIAESANATESATESPSPVPTVTQSPSPEPLNTQTPTPAEDISQKDYSLIDNSGDGWGFKKNKGAEPSIYQSTKDLLSKYDAYYMDQSKPRAIYLTFDEGYENGYTASILDTLKKCDVKAAFFITGDYLDTEKELIKRMIDEGHIVGNHTVNHPNLHKLSDPAKISSELTTLNSELEKEFGYTMKYMRPPEGEYSERVLAIAKDAGFKTILWSFAYMDWDPEKQKGADYAIEQVMPYLHDGAIVLLHAVSSDNAAALETIINNAKAQGYEFRTLDQLQ